MMCDKMLAVRLLCVFISVVAVECACPYVAKIKKAGPCASNKNPVLTLDKFDVKLVGDDCRIQIMGCLVFNEDIKSLEVKYKVFKEGLPVVTGSKQGCGYKDKNFEIKCPLKKKGKLCPGSETIEVPGGVKSLDLAKGNLKVQIDLMTPSGKYCYEGEGVVGKK